MWQTLIFSQQSRNHRFWVKTIGKHRFRVKMWKTSILNQKCRKHRFRVKIVENLVKNVDFLKRKCQKVDLWQKISENVNFWSNSGNKVEFAKKCATSATTVYRSVSGLLPDTWRELTWIKTLNDFTTCLSMTVKDIEIYSYGQDLCYQVWFCKKFLLMTFLYLQYQDHCLNKVITLSYCQDLVPPNTLRG